MWQSLFETSKFSPFKGLFSYAQCESSDRRTLNSPVPGRTVGFAAAAPPRQPEDSCEFGSAKYFALCGFGGAISCGGTHMFVVPLDVVKCRLQIDPVKYKNLIHGLKLTVKEDGIKGLARGWAPTLFGFSIQGGFKYGLYEYFKILYSDLAGEENAYIYRTELYMASSACAEFFADIGLCSFESIKVKIQTTPGFATTLREAVPKMWKEEGPRAFYKSLIPLWCRQVPYTMVKFTSFERILELLYKVIPKPRSECTKGEQLLVTFTAGCLAGIICAIISHPADTVVSKLNQEKGSTVIQVVKDLGFATMWKGLETRILMIAALTALQWFSYDTVKVTLGIPRPPPPEMPESLKEKEKSKK